jgi:hypothetical protein
MASFGDLLSPFVLRSELSLLSSNNFTARSPLLLVKILSRET